MSTGNASITTLPTELIAEIFEHAAKDAHGAYVRRIKREALPTDPGFPRPYRWIRLTHVCRLWRMIALSRPMLWSDISIIDADATEEILRRTEGCNITLTFRIPAGSLAYGRISREEVDKRRSIYGRLLAAEVHRITEVVAPAIPDYITPAITAQASQLRSFIILPPSGGGIDLSPGVLAFPALEHLEYRAASRTSLIPMLSTTLRTLVLRTSQQDGPYFHAAYMLDVREVVRSLRGLPVLESLDVDIGDTWTTPPEKVAAPHLRSVRLVGISSACVYFLQHITLPRDVRLAVECVHAAGRMPMRRPTPVSTAIAEILDAPPGTEFTPCTVLSIHADAKAGYELRGWRDPAQRNAHGVADVVLRCSLEGPFSDFEVLLRAFTLHHVQHICIRNLPRGQDAVEGILDFVRRSNLKTVALDDVSVPRALELLAEGTATDITLANINFKPSDCVHAERWLRTMRRKTFSVSPNEPSSAVDLAARLAERSRAGRSVQRLRFVGAKNVQAEDVKLLQGQIASVEWDGIEVVDLGVERRLRWRLAYP